MVNSTIKTPAGTERMVKISGAMVSRQNTPVSKTAISAPPMMKLFPSLVGSTMKRPVAGLDASAWASMAAQMKNPNPTSHKDPQSNRSGIGPATTENPYQA